MSNKARQYLCDVKMVILLTVAAIFLTLAGIPKKAIKDKTPYSRIF